MTRPLIEGLPSPNGNTNARKLFKSPEVIGVTTLLVVPVAQWADIAIHVETSGGNFTFRARWLDLDGSTYEDTDPAVDATLHVSGARTKYVITALEHNGEPYLQCGIVVPTANINIQNFDIMGTPN